MDTFNDKTLSCIDCGGEFLFSKNEQAFYAERGFTNEPKRCKVCRDKRKSSRDGNGGSRERQMVSVTCDSCGVARGGAVPRGAGKASFWPRLLQRAPWPLPPLELGVRQDASQPGKRRPE